MNILFIHQNFPGQFKHLAAHLAKNKQNRVIALRCNKGSYIENVETYEYPILSDASVSINPLLGDIESKVRRAESLVDKAKQCDSLGFRPDVVIIHPSWGEGLFLRDLWPKVKIIAYLEYYYRYEGQDVNFDPEFPSANKNDRYRLRLKNFTNLYSLDEADLFITPTKWQLKQFPKWTQKKINVIHDGIDTESCCANSDASITLTKANKVLTKKDKVITYVSRGLEPIRGFHIFMRSLPLILQECPDVHVLIVGGDVPAYGVQSEQYSSFKEQLLNELNEKLDPKQVHFLGRLSYKNYQNLLQISSAHIYLTYPFITSWSLLEAMSIECPIVASNTGPVTEFIQHNKNGLLVDFFNHEQLSEAVIKLLNNLALGTKLGKQARKMILDKYNLKLCLSKQLKLI